MFIRLRRSDLQPPHTVCISRKRKSAGSPLLPSPDTMSDVNSGESGHPVIAAPLHLISELVTRATKPPTPQSPKASHQIIIFSLGSMQRDAATIKPTAGLIKRLAVDLLSPGSAAHGRLSPSYCLSSVFPQWY